MKYVPPVWLKEAAYKVGKVNFFKSLLRPIYYTYKQKLQSKRNKNFHEHALSALKAFDKCMTDHDVTYTLIFGSLLGAVRERGFIKHDMDIDVALFIEDRSEALYDILKESGFELIRRFSIDDGTLGCEETFEYSGTGVTLDIFYICPAVKEYQYCCCWNLAEGCASFRESVRKIGGVYPRLIDQPIKDKMKRVPFEDIEVSITENAHECLLFAYGPDYLIPDPNYVTPTEHRTVWNDKIAKVEFFKGLL